MDSGRESRTEGSKGYILVIKEALRFVSIVDPIQVDLTMQIREDGPFRLETEQQVNSTAPDGCVHREAVMASCLALISLDLFTNNLRTAQAHLLHSLQVMREWRKSNFDSSLVGPALSTAMGHLLLKWQMLSNPASP